MARREADDGGESSGRAGIRTGGTSGTGGTGGTSGTGVIAASLALIGEGGEARLAADVEILVESGAIQEVRNARGPVPERMIAPGFVDIQMNGTGPVSVASADDDGWAYLASRMLESGVTTWCPTLISDALPALERSLLAIDAKRKEWTRARGAITLPSIAGAHLEGPFITLAGAHPQEHLRERIDIGWLRQIAPTLAVVTMAPELPGAMEAIAELSNDGVLVALGHSSCSFDDALKAAEAGARAVTHLGNAMAPFHQRQPGLLGAALVDDRLTPTVIADRAHVHPALIELAFRAKGTSEKSGVVLVTDSVADLPPPHGSGPAAGPTGPVRLLDGTLAGSRLTMIEAIRTVTNHAAVPLEQALLAASSTPARLIGAADRGAILPGRRADLVALTLPPDLRVAEVWIGGTHAWP
jgi:N-acetylglucosamine-6-phosphate deacetylase